MSDILSLLISFPISFGLLLLAVSAHEFAHGWVAYKRGDNTAKYAGRLTLNPLAHIDIFWTLILPLSLFIISRGAYVFGAAKPVPINYQALKNPKRDIIWIGLSGPLANFLFAIIASILFKFIPEQSILSLLARYLVYINVLLGLFNLIPVPPLDGSRILMGLLPQKLSAIYASIEPFGFIIIMLFMGTMFRFFIGPLMQAVLNILGVPFQ